jgi:hypothetical protein
MTREEKEQTGKYVLQMDRLLEDECYQQEPCEDVISRKSIKQKLQEHHDFFVNAYGGFSNLPQNEKSRVDEITNCIAMVVNEPPVTLQEPFINKPCVSSGVCEHDKQNVLDKLRSEIIERDKNIKSVRSDSCCFFTAEEVLEIIDKYKTDIKPQESEE